MRVFTVTAFFTVPRNSEDSSPNTIRPLQSTTRIPSFVRVASFSFISTSPFYLMEMRFPINSGHSPQGVLRLNGRELLFGEAGRLAANKFTPLANLCNRQASLEEPTHIVSP